MSVGPAGRARMRTAAWAVGGLVLGFVVGLAAVAVHSWWWGLVLGLAATLAALVAMRPGWGRVGFAAGWLTPVALATIPRPEGDYAIGTDVTGYGILAGAVVVLAVALATVPVAPRTRK
ncbi:MAG: DUF6113 family protein [Nocardioides sp.]|uniref:DUF6113 family protein n=1 Tax=Nocardioides sp. TaxID=35761 RepID=UPI0039E54DD6